MSDIARAARQEQFLEVIDRDEAQRRFAAKLNLAPLASETVPLTAALDRVLSEDVISQVDVPGFDRANVDGFAGHAADTFGATEVSPRYVHLNAEVVSPGVVPGAVFSAVTRSLSFSVQKARPSTSMIASPALTPATTPRAAMSAPPIGGAIAIGTRLRID